VASGVAAGLATLAKGPVGVVLPFGVSLLFLLWNRKLALLFDRRLLWGALAYLLVALPWFVLVGNETRAEFLRGFFGQHNVGRFLRTMENHGGGFYYYGVVLLVGLMPWSVFLAPVLWFGIRDCPSSTENSYPIYRERYRFLFSWMVVYFLFFTASATKLPNYVLPIYAPSVLLTARFLEQWRRGFLTIPRWVFNVCLAILATGGLALSLGVLVVSGTWSLPRVQVDRLPALGPWAGLGVLPVAGAALAWWLVRRENRLSALVGLTTAGVAFCGLLAVPAEISLDRYKAPRELIREAGAQDVYQDVRIACYQYFQPSLVFYCRREVEQLRDERQLSEFLRGPLRSYVVLPADVWEAIRTPMADCAFLLARHHDFYRRCDVVVVTNGNSRSTQFCANQAD
jgi:4-amino-4-deoxy-L-arabinose transferase-like glycosyltransferase